MHKLECGQYPGETHARRHHSLSAAPKQRVQRMHGQTGRPVYKSYGRATHYTSHRRCNNSHQQYANREELAKLVFSQREKCYKSSSLKSTFTINFFI